MKKLGILLIALVGFGISSFGQVSASASSSASIVVPIAIAKSSGGDLSFGNIASDAVGGTVVLSPTTGLRTSSTVKLPSVTGTVSAASFDVTGFASSTFSITLPGSITLSRSGGGTMTVSSFVSDPLVASGGLLDASGNATVKVGGTLTVAANQTAGTYTNSSDLTVTVNYN